MLDDQDIRWKVARGAGGTGERPAALPGPHLRPGDWALALPPDCGGLAGALLASMVPLVFCSGLIGLAVLPPLGVGVPRGLILAHGASCALLALLALLLSRPWQQAQPSARQNHGYPKGADVDGGPWTAPHPEWPQRMTSRTWRWATACSMVAASPLGRAPWAGTRLSA
jgi:hypothetical protein